MTFDEAQKWLALKFPSESVKFIGSGSDSVAFRVGTRVFRFPHSHADIYKTEAAICDFVRPNISVPIPKIEIFNEDGVQCVAHEMIMGEKWSWHRFQFQPARQRRLADSLARFLAQLHGCDARRALRQIPALRDSVPFCTFDEVSDFLGQYMSPRQLRVFRRNYERIIGAPIDADDMTIVHTGLKGPNSVADKTGALCGVFDFGNAGVYERWRDFELFYLGHNAALYRGVCRAYERYTGRPVPRRRIEDLAVIEFLWRKRVFPGGHFAPRTGHFMRKNIAMALTRFYHLPRWLWWPVYMSLRKGA